MRYWQNLATTAVLLQSTRTPNNGFLKTWGDEMLHRRQRLRIPAARLQRTATELADAKTTATEHYFCLIGVGACAQILISEPEREALTQKKACVTTAMHPQQHTMAAPWQVPQTASPHGQLACVASSCMEYSQNQTACTCIKPR